MGLLTEPFNPLFMQRALVAGLLAVVVTSLVGTWVVLRGLAFLGDALAHGVIPGVALALLLGFSPVLGALAAALVMSGLLTLVSTRAAVREDTGIGLLFVGMLSLGVIIVSRSSTITADVSTLLFGDVLGVSSADLAVEVAAAVVVLVITVVLRRPFLALAFNRDKATTLGMHPRLAQAALHLLLAVSIVASFQTIGTLLVFGLLVGPPATAALLVRRIPLIMALSTCFGALAVVIGLLLSYHHGLAGGASIAAVCVAQFFFVLAGREVASLRRSPAV